MSVTLTVCLRPQGRIDGDSRVQLARVLLMASATSDLVVLDLRAAHELPPLFDAFIATARRILELRGGTMQIIPSQQPMTDFDSTNAALSAVPGRDDQA